MPRLHYSERSRADVDTFWEYIAADRPRFAAAVLEHLHEKIERLRTQPLVVIPVRAPHRKAPRGDWHQLQVANLAEDHQLTIDGLTAQFS